MYVWNTIVKVVDFSRLKNTKSQLISFVIQWTGEQDGWKNASILQFNICWCIMEYRERYPTCPQCGNESVELLSDNKGNVLECFNCDFKARLKIEITELY